MALTCPDCGAGVAADARFCAACGARLSESSVQAREVRKVVTILFADVTGSTALGEHLDPETLRGLMNRYFARMRTVIEAHGGTVEKFIGDAVMAVFGIPQMHEDDALRAVRAAWEIREQLASLNAELEAERGIAVRFRTGVNTGEVVAGDPSGGTTLVTGDTVNTAARLEQAAPPGEILLGRLTYSLVRDAVDAEPLEPVVAKGKASPVEAYRLTAVRAGEAGHARHLDAPLVGRERELERLSTAYRSAVADRACALFTLLGPAGVGKSRLTSEFVQSVADEARVLRGRCLNYGEGVTYWPIGEIVRDAAGITEADDAVGALERLRILLGDTRDADLVADRIGAAIGLTAAQAPTEEVAWAVRRLLEHLADDRPLVVVIEDIHWAEPTLLELIEHVADWTRDRPILLLCPARPELLDAQPGWGGGKLNATTLLLEPLGGDATERLIDALPGGAALPPAVAARIMTAAEGNPLYVEELLAMLVDDGLVSYAEDTGWRAKAGLADVHIPPSIGLLLAARLERLAPDERRVAEHASVVGRVFEQAAVEDLASDDARNGVTAALLSLVRKELVRPERGDLLTASQAFKFRHVLIRDAAYDALPKSERAELHERVARWLEHVAGDRLSEIEEIVGHHLEQAYDYRRALGEAGPRVDALARDAADHMTAAGARAEERGDARSALALLTPALALRGAPRDEDDDLRLRMSEALWSVGRIDEAIQVAEEVLQRAQAAGHLGLAARALVAVIDLKSGLGQAGLGSATFDDMLRDAVALVDASDDERAKATYWKTMSTWEWEHERFDASHDALERARRHYAAAGDERGLNETDVMLVVETVSGPTTVGEAIAVLDGMLARPRGRQDYAYLLARRAIMRAMAMDDEGARSDGLESAAIYLDLGISAYHAESLWHLSWTSRLADEYEREADELTQAMVHAMSPLVPFLSALRGLAFAKLGRFAEARADLDASAEDTWYRTIRLRKLVSGRLAANDGHPEAARSSAATVEAEVAPQIHFLNQRAEATLECGVISALVGDVEEARRRGGIALETAERKGSLAMMRKARALIAGDLSRL